MSWINLNESFNQLKGQISTFASNVLTDEGADNNDVEELQRLCVSQKEEINRLLRLNQELEKANVANESSKDAAGDNWSWESPVPETKSKIDDRAELKAKIAQLESEKLELTQSLESLDNDFQQNTEKLVSVKDKLQAVQGDYNELEDKYVKVRDKNKALQSELSKHRKELDDLKNKYQEALSKHGVIEESNGCTKCEHFSTQILNLQAQVDEFKEEVNALSSNNAMLQKALEDEKSSNNSATVQLKEKLKLAESENKILVSELQKSTKELNELKQKSQAEEEHFSKLALILEEYEAQVNVLKQELEKERQFKPTSDEELTRLNQEIINLQELLKNAGEDKEKQHNKYITILTENIKKFADCSEPSDFQDCSKIDDPKLADFSHQVESIVKILLDLKFKCDALEKDLCNITQEKTKLLTEKNHEIEKLMQNSEILSQEVITKSQTIKDYEIEINELIKNNNILIVELEQYKNSSGLQTISESNEDNLLMMESQLENANKRIEELEETLKKLELREEDEIIKEMGELHLKENSMNVHDNLKSENASLKQNIVKLNQERDEIQANFEKLKSDLENAEYQLAETNINMESLKEEIEEQRRKVEEAIAQKTALEKLNVEIERNNEDIRSDLNEIRSKLLFEEDTRKQYECQVRNLTEKLQNAKMCETSLKLQYDTVSKELIAMTEAKAMLESSLKNTLVDFKQCQDNFIVLQNENDELKKLYEVCSVKLKDYELEIARRDEIISRLNIVEKQYEKLAIEESGTLLNNLHLDNKENENCAKQMEVETSNVPLIADQFETISLEQTNIQDLQQQLNAVIQERNNLQTEIAKLISINKQHENCLQNISFLERQVTELTASKNELTNVVIVKHQENVTYHNEIQRLSQLLNAEVEKAQNLQSRLDEAAIAKKSEEIEKLTEQNDFLRKKCEVLAENLLQEQSRVQQLLSENSQPSEKEQALTKKLERLQSHLIELEEHYTQELLRAEERNNELQTKVNEIEQREKNSSTMYTSVSIRANQHVETLQHQLQLITNQRDELRKKVSDMEDNASKQAASLANLQFVLEQFQKDKDKDVQKETERIRRQINVEKKVQDELKNEIASLQSQLSESKQGLQAASRLSDQLEQSKQTVLALKSEVSQLKDKLLKNEEQLKAVSSQTDGKVDKTLIKNLIIGFVTTNNNLTKDQTQILKIIATVLDFNQQDHDKLNLNKPQQGWLSSLLAPQNSQGMTQESLSQAFVKFLENESKPRVVPSLLTNSSNEETPNSRKSSTSTAPRQSPIVLSEVVLPTFADFAQNRNSSSILKDVLKDNSQ